MTRSPRFRPAAWAATLFLATALGACADAPTGTPSAPGPDPLVEHLVQMGFSRDQIVDRGDHFVVEGDIRFNKNDLRAAAPAAPDGRAHPSGGPLLQRYTSAVSPSRRVVHVDLSAVDAENASWAAATRAAMANWSAVSGTYLSFVEGGTPDITVSFVNSLGSCVVAQGAFPASGAPGTSVEISRSYVSSYTYAKQVWIMSHELGHNVGLAHTDQSSFGTRVPNTPSSSDGGSVMNSGQTYPGCPPAAPDWAGFSSHDQTAIGYLYPIPTPTGLTSSHPSGTVVLGWPSAAGAAYYQVRSMELYRDQNFYENWSYEYPTEGEWVNVFGTSYDTGLTWTGNSQCVWYQTLYEQQATSYSLEMRAVYPNGTSGITSVPGPYGPC